MRVSNYLAAKEAKALGVQTAKKELTPTQRKHIIDQASCDGYCNQYKGGSISY